MLRSYIKDILTNTLRDGANKLNYNCVIVSLDPLNTHSETYLTITEQFSFFIYFLPREVPLISNALLGDDLS